MPPRRGGPWSALRRTAFLNLPSFDFVPKLLDSNFALPQGLPRLPDFRVSVFDFRLFPGLTLTNFRPSKLAKILHFPVPKRPKRSNFRRHPFFMLRCLSHKTRHLCAVFNLGESATRYHLSRKCCSCPSQSGPPSIPLRTPRSTHEISAPKRLSVRSASIAF